MKGLRGIGYAKTSREQKIQMKFSGDWMLRMAFASVRAAMRFMLGVGMTPPNVPDTA
jgi:hypothetical protein